jgi:O-antigen/teichoic acid export membrane protein
MSLLERARRTAATRPLVRATSGTFALRVGSAGLLLGTAVILARELGAAGYGAYSYATAWAGVLATPAILGFDRLLVRSVAAWEAVGSWGLMRGLLRRGNQIVGAASAMLVLLAAVVGGLLLHEPFRGPFLLGLALVPLIALTGVRKGAMQGLGRVVLGNVPDLLVRPTLLFIGLAVVVVGGSGLDPAGAMAVNVVATGAAFLVCVVLLRRAQPARLAAAKPGYETRAWLATATPMMFVSGMLAINYHLAEVLLGSLDNAHAVGVFVVANRVTQVMTFLPYAVNAVLAPRFARLYALGRFGELQALVTLAVRRLTLATVPIAVALVLFQTPVLHVFGNEFESAGTALVILTVGQLVSIVAGSVAVLLMMTGYERDAAAGVGLGLLVNLTLGTVLIPAMGADGAALATAGSLACWNGVLALLVHKRLRIDATLWGGFSRTSGT